MHAASVALIAGARWRRVDWDRMLAVNLRAAVNMMRAAAEIEDAGVTVNAVLPATIDTPQVRSWRPGERLWKKWVDPRALGWMMLWLRSDAGRDVTGALLPFIGRQPHPCHDWHGVTDSAR